MVKVMFGEQGSGKTKQLIDTCNTISASNSGDIVYIDVSNDHMYDLKHQVRFINISEYPVAESCELAGFLCGVLSEDYDLQAIFLDSLNQIVREDLAVLDHFFNRLKILSERFQVDFYVGITSDAEIPQYMKEYIGLSVTA